MHGAPAPASLPGVPTTPFTEADARRLGPVRRWFFRHPVGTDRVVSGIFTFLALGGLGTMAGPPDPQAVIAGVVVLVGAVVLLYRRRAPFVVLGLVLLLGVVEVLLVGTVVGFDLAAAFVVYTIAANRSSREAWIALGVSVVVAAGSLVLWGNAADRYVQLTGYGISVLVGIAIGTSVRNRRQHVAELVDRGNRLARENAQRAELASAAERARIAREMHDVVAHSLSVMVALADGASAAIQRSPDRAQEAIEKVSDTGRSALADMRRVLGMLRDPDTMFGPQPGAQDLDELVQGYRAAGLPVHLTVIGPPLPADQGLQLAVFRVIQESLTNALRHAPGAGRVDVRLHHEPDRVIIDVTDDGGIHAPAVDAPVTPPSLAAGGGRGLVGIRERVAVYGGEVAAGPFRGGWSVHAVLPIPEEESP